MSCRSEFESEPLWMSFAESADEATLWKAMDELLTLAAAYRSRHPETSKRLDRLFDQGDQVFERRFGAPWLPF